MRVTTAGALALIWQCLYWAWFGSEILMVVLTRTRRSGGQVRDRGSMLLLWVVIASSITLSQWLSFVTRAPLFGGGAWLGNTALVVLMVGLAVRWTSILSLGRAFSVNVAIRDAQQLNRSGLYSLVRHPSYTGLVLIFLALGLRSANWISLLVVMVPTTLALLYRMHVEEEALRGAFGAQYVEYSKSTKRLIPGIY